MKILDIDLNPYVTIHTPRSWSYMPRRTPAKKYPELSERSEGLRAAKEHQLSKKAADVGQIRLTLTNGINVRETFLKAFLGPTVRKIGPSNLMTKITIVNSNIEFIMAVQNYVKEEASNIKERAKKVKMAREVVWSEDKFFFLPEIGTRLRLSEDWEFDLHSEHRNSTFFKQISITSYYQLNSPTKAKVRAGGKLTVDRIYIRKGAKDYSSVTFHLKKGAEVEYNGGLYKMNGARFWAKLRDVNKMHVQVDLNSVPGLEVNDDN